MKSSEKNWSQSMAQLRPWFLGSGSPRRRLDEGPSSSNRTVNSRCSEIDTNTTERSPFPVASAQQRRSIPMELLPVELRKALPPLYSHESCPDRKSTRLNSSHRCI